jgi:hypothetical protein
MFQLQNDGCRWRYDSTMTELTFDVLCWSVVIQLQTVAVLA